MPQELSVHLNKVPPTLSKKGTGCLEVSIGEGRGGGALERSTRFSSWNETTPRIGPTGFGFRQENKTRGREGGRFSSKK